MNKFKLARLENEQSLKFEHVILFNEANTITLIFF